MLANKTNDNRTYQPCREGKGSCKTLTATAAALKGWGGHVAAPLAEDSDFSLCQSKIRIYSCNQIFGTEFAYNIVDYEPRPRFGAEPFWIRQHFGRECWRIRSKFGIRSNYPEFERIPNFNPE